VARPLSWSDVRGGAIAAVALVAIGAAILKFFRFGDLRGETFKLIAFVGEARGVLVGSEVWLSGQKVGKITSIHFRPPSSDSTERVEIDMEMMERYRAAIHHDAIAQIRNGGTVIGAPVVYLSAGTIAARGLLPGDTIRSRPQNDVEGATGKFGTAAKEFPAIAKDVRALMAEVKGTEGAVGAFLNGPGGPGSPQIAKTRLEFARLATQVRGARALRPDTRADVLQRAQRILARVDSVRGLMSSEDAALGRLRKDSTLLAEVGDIRNEIGVVRTMLDESNGTAGRILNDRALFDALAGAQNDMSSLMADLKKHPLRYIKF
jgi:phospholipid/cholesterol/gamma-HCH transport system substrate-binding protein